MRKTTKKFLAIILVAIMLIAQCSFLGNISLAAATEPNFASPGYAEPANGGINPYSAAGYYGQCTWYVWGRAYELTGVQFGCTGAATQYQYWVNSSVPRENSIMVWGGHVAFVEAYDGTNITISQANTANRWDWMSYEEGVANYDGRMTKTAAEWDSYGLGPVLGYIYIGEDPTPADTENPSVSNVTVSDKDKEGFTITADVADNVEVTKVSFYVTVDGQEKVFNAPSISGGKASVRINYSDYGLTSGTSKATANIWAYDAAGNTSNTGTTELDIDLDDPMITDVQVTNITGEGYNLTFKVSDNVGVTKVQCPTWNSSEDEDGLPSDWETNSNYTAIEKAGTYTYHVNIDNVESEKVGGTYVTLISAIDEYGNTKTYRVSVDVYPITDVTLNENEIELYKGQNFVLEAGYEPLNTTGDKTVTWTSSDEEVATVEDGIVKALKEGTTTITATIDGVSETCEVTVKEIPLGSIAIEDQNVQLKINEEKQLTVLYNPNDTTDDKTVVWTSSDESIVKVTEDGKIIGLKAGKAIITATVGDKTATTEVTVTEEVAENAENGENGDTSGLPKTSDMQVPLLVAGMIISLAGIVYIVRKNRK